MGWIGFNCSIPHKVAVIEHLDGLGDSAMVIGAPERTLQRHRDASVKPCRTGWPGENLVWARRQYPLSRLVERECSST
jgi:hypothetical protein